MGSERSQITLSGLRKIRKGCYVVEQVIGLTHDENTGLFSLNDRNVCQPVSWLEDESTGTAEKMYQTFVDRYVETHLVAIEQAEVFRLHIHDFLPGHEPEAPSLGVLIHEGSNRQTNVIKKVYFEYLMGEKITDLQKLAHAISTENMDSIFFRILMPLVPVQVRFQTYDSFS